MSEALRTGSRTIATRQDHLGQPIGEAVPDWQPVERPPRRPIIRPVELRDPETFLILDHGLDHLADRHFVHEKSSGPAPLPLIISHGWPGSIVELLDIIEPLAHPERFAGRAEDAFDVVAPSLPGFGFSDRPPRPIGPRRMADLFDALMTDVLGYDGYLAQGGDWGGAISSWLGFDHAPACRAIHINIVTMRHSDGPQGPEEERWAVKLEREQEMEEGYRTIQATKPQTLSYAMIDSRVGVAVWIVEKFHAWSDTVGDDIAGKSAVDSRGKRASARFVNSPG